MQIIAGLSKVTWRKTEKERLFSAKKEQEAAFNGRSALRESLLEAWNVDIHTARRICEWRLVVVECLDG